MSEQHTAESLASLLDTHNRQITYVAEFVPQSKSRNAGDKNKSLNWKIRLECGGRKLETDYMQGIGHLPEQAKRALNRIKTGNHDRTTLESYFAENGKYAQVTPSGYMLTFKVNGSFRFPAPPLLDVLYSLLLDSGAIDYGTFEDWASEFGYETDSRKAEAIYRACLETGLTLRAMLGDACMSALREFFQDY